MNTASAIVQILGVLILAIFLGLYLHDQQPKPKQAVVPMKWEYIEVESMSSDSDEDKPLPANALNKYVGSLHEDDALSNKDDWELCATFTRTYTPQLKGTDGNDLVLSPKTATFFVFKRQVPAN